MLSFVRTLIGIQIRCDSIGAMEKAQNHRMTVDEFLAWAEAQEGRYELHDGEVFSMAAERAIHAEVKFAVQSALQAGIRKAGLPCFMLPDV